MAEPEARYAVWVETGGKQRYVFGTNKLREIVGASRIVALSTTAWLEAAAERVTRGREGVRAEEKVAISGRALWEVTAPAAEVAEEVARGIVTEVTAIALRLAPGLIVTGAVAPITAADGLDAQARRGLIERVAEHRANLPPPEDRLQRLPVGASCRTGDGPAAGYYDDASGDGYEPLSAASIAKRMRNDDGRYHNRLIVDGKDVPENKWTLVRPSQFEKELAGDIRWLGVVHADGNKIGALVSSNMNHSDYCDFCHHLDDCTQQALRDAIDAVVAIRHRRFPERADKPVTVLPLVASGDDMTALVDGYLAIPFAAAYLRAFERRSAASEVLRRVVRSVYPEADRLTAAAGIAVVKPHFPFPHAYRLCEQACDSAKKLAGAGVGDAHAGRLVSALDWHVHYDPTGAELEALRGRPVVGDGPILRSTRKPYAIAGPGGALPPAFARRDFAELERLVRDVPVEPHPDDAGALPMTQLIRLAEAAHAAVGAGDAGTAQTLFATLQERPELALLKQLDTYHGEGKPRLFAELPQPQPEHGQSTGPGLGERVRAPYLLDFLELVSEHLLPSPDDAPEAVGAGVAR